MMVYLNGRFVPADQATVSVFDRGFLYGDALFESLRVESGFPFLWEAHIQRLAQGAAALQIPLALDSESLRSSVSELLRLNGLTHAVVRISLSRGQGQRGYSIRGAGTPTLVIAAHPAPAPNELPTTPWRLHTASSRLPAKDPVAGFKTANKLTHILARTEAEAAGADEALLLNTDGHLTETSAANLFWLQDRTAHTPALDAGGLAGVTREFVLRLLRSSGWETRETLAEPASLFQASGIFITLSTLGIVEISHLDQRPLARDPRVAGLRDNFWNLLRREANADGICH